MRERTIKEFPNGINAYGVDALDSLLQVWLAQGETLILTYLDVEDIEIFAINCGTHIVSF